MPTYSPYVQERWELVEYVNSTVLADVAQPVWRESSAAGGLADVYGLSRLSTSGGNESLAIADAYLEDGLGSVSAVLREGGAVAASLSYSPWGEEELATESLPGYGDRFERPHYGYNAEQSSPEGGLQYLRARWYDPSMGAFGSRDSLLGDAADPATLNRYAYAEGNPVASCDPTGHESRVKYGGANAKRIRRLASNPRRGVGASTGIWMSRNYTQRALSSKKPGLLTTRRVSNPVLASGGKRRAAVQSSAKPVVSTGAGKMQAWVGAQTTGRSLAPRRGAAPSTARRGATATARWSSSARRPSTSAPPVRGASSPIPIRHWTLWALWIPRPCPTEPMPLPIGSRATMRTWRYPPLPRSCPTGAIFSREGSSRRASRRQRRKPPKSPLQR